MDLSIQTTILSATCNTGAIRWVSQFMFSYQRRISDTQTANINDMKTSEPEEHLEAPVLGTQVYTDAHAQACLNHWHEHGHPQ